MRDLIKAMKRLAAETGSLACMGCGHEHNCNLHGCAILREAVEELEHRGWICAADRLPTDIPDDFVLGVVTGEGKNVIYQDAVCLVGYDEKTGWYLEEDPTIDVTVSWWMQIPEPPKEKKE